MEDGPSGFLAWQHKLIGVTSGTAERSLPKGLFHLQHRSHRASALWDVSLVPVCPRGSGRVSIHTMATTALAHRKQGSSQEGCATELWRLHRPLLPPVVLPSGCCGAWVWG